MVQRLDFGRPSRRPSLKLSKLPDVDAETTPRCVKAAKGGLKKTIDKARLCAARRLFLVHDTEGVEEKDLMDDDGNLEPDLVFSATLSSASPATSETSIILLRDSSDVVASEYYHEEK